MRKMLASVAAAVLALSAGVASAGQWVGTIQEIDEVSRNITVQSQFRPELEGVFAVSDMNTVGATIDDLQEGDRVRVFYAESDSDSGWPMNAMQIDKLSGEGDAAMMGATQEMEGQVERLDETAGTVTVGGEEFALADPTLYGIALGDLEEGDQVRVVYQDADQGRREVIEINKVR